MIDKTDDDALLDENDTCELLRNLEIVLRGGALSPSTYLWSLAEIQSRNSVVEKGSQTKRDLAGSASGPAEHDAQWSNALSALEAVRLAAARNLSRMDF